MEKDIEILESFIKQLEEFEDEEELKQAIENLINRVKELEQQYDKLSRHFIQNHVSKDKIKAKIEGLRDVIQYSANPLAIDNSKYAIDILQEVLEEQEDK